MYIDDYIGTTTPIEETVWDAVAWLGVRWKKCLHKLSRLLDKAIKSQMKFHIRIPNSKYSPNHNPNPNPNSYDNALF